MARSPAPRISSAGKTPLKLAGRAKGRVEPKRATKTDASVSPGARKKSGSSESVPGLALLRGLVAENLVLRREVAELRLLTAGACHDPMTGLGNRAFLRQRLAEELSRSLRRAEHGGVLVLVRVADLRVLARGAERRACLEAIQALAQSFRAALRVADLCCRVGFGSFGFLLPDTDPSGAGRVVRRLRAAAMRVSARASVPLAVSFGLTSWPIDGMTLSKIWNGAAAALAHEEEERGHAAGPAGQRPRATGGRGLKVLRGGLSES